MKVLSRFFHPTEHRLMQPGEDFTPSPHLRRTYVKNGVLAPETEEERAIAPRGPVRPRRKVHEDAVAGGAEAKVDAPAKVPAAKPSRKPAAKKAKKGK